jgi:hypothetical protein
MTDNEEVSVRKRRSSQEIKRLLVELEASGLRQIATAPKAMRKHSGRQELPADLPRTAHQV